MSGERRSLLQIIGHPEFGVPYGQDRIVPKFLATLAVRQKSQTIRFRSASEMLATFGLQRGGKGYRRLIASFERIFGATMFFGTESQTAKARVVQRSRFNFLREAQIWYNRSPESNHASTTSRTSSCRVTSSTPKSWGTRSDGSRGSEGAHGITRSAGSLHVVVVQVLHGKR